MPSDPSTDHDLDDIGVPDGKGTPLGEATADRPEYRRELDRMQLRSDADAIVVLLAMAGWVAVLGFPHVWWWALAGLFLCAILASAGRYRVIPGEDGIEVVRR